jgi:hypothetical protein
VTANSFARDLAFLLPMPLSFTSSNIFLLCAVLFYAPRINIVQTDKLCWHLGRKAVIEFRDKLKATNR